MGEALARTDQSEFSEAAIGLQLEQPGVAIAFLMAVMSMALPRRSIPTLILFRMTPSVSRLLVPHALIVIVLDRQTERDIRPGSHGRRRQSGDEKGQ
jgi:hypothetical protein